MGDSASERTMLELERRYGFSAGAVASMLQAVRAGGGRMAQFRHPEFGGGGQWMAGGMTMVSDLFDTDLKGRVAGLCGELARLVATDAAAGASSAERVTTAHLREWWPPGLGRPDAAGSQNNVRYAYFAEARRLAIDDDGAVRVYDTLGHKISGVAQQRSAASSLKFSSDRGVVDVATLPLAHERGPASTSAPAGDVVATLEKLGELRAKGILSEAEFAAKKAEMLRRL